MKKKQWEPETAKCPAGITKVNASVPFRVIREKDYQRLLKLARKAQTAKRTP